MLALLKKARDAQKARRAVQANRVELPAVEAERVELPADVLAAIEGAHIIIRPGKDDDGTTPTVFVQWPGNGGLQAWRYADDTAFNTFSKMYPELNAFQISRATRAVAGLVSQALRNSASPYVPESKPRWSATQW